MNIKKIFTEAYVSSARFKLAIQATTTLGVMLLGLALTGLFFTNVSHYSLLVNSVTAFIIAVLLLLAAGVLYLIKTKVMKITYQVRGEKIFIVNVTNKATLETYTIEMTAKEEEKLRTSDSPP